MTRDDLTPDERDHVQMVYLRRWLATKCPRGSRRKTDRAEQQPPSVTAECRRLASYGRTQRQIATKVGVSQTTVHRHIRYFNMEGRRVA